MGKRFVICHVMGPAAVSALCCLGPWRMHASHDIDTGSASLLLCVVAVPHIDQPHTFASVCSATYHTEANTGNKRTNQVHRTDMQANNKWLWNPGYLPDHLQENRPSKTQGRFRMESKRKVCGFTSTIRLPPAQLTPAMLYRRYCTHALRDKAHTV